MTTLTEFQTALATQFPSPSVITWSDWGPILDKYQQNVFPGYVHTFVHILHMTSGGVLVAENHWRVVCQGDGSGTDPVWCMHFDPGGPSDAQRFRVKVLEWAAARVAQDWFVDVNHWGEECALAWGINESGVVRTSKLTWDGTKTDLVIVYDLPNPGAPELSVATTKVVLDPAATELDFSGGYIKQLAVNSTRTLTSTIPPSGREVYLVIVASGTTSRTITFGDGFGRVQGTLATGTVNGVVFILQFISDGTQLHETGRTAAMSA